jgi:hypothetical protein
MASETLSLPSPTSSEQEKAYWLEETDKYYEGYVSLPEISGWWGIPINDVVTIPHAARFLGYAPSQDQSKSSSELLQNLRDLSPMIAQNHEEKSTALQDLKFRLIMPGGDRILESPSEISYIAVSYRWRHCDMPEWGTAYDIHSETLDLEARPTSTEMHDLPFSPILYKALLSERASPNEGIWIDQLCINQDDEVEKSHTIPAMDLIYGRASVVVVILGDICLNQAEFGALGDMAEEIRESKAGFRSPLAATLMRAISQQDPIGSGDSFDPSVLSFDPSALFGRGNFSPFDETRLGDTLDYTTDGLSVGDDRPYDETEIADTLDPTADELISIEDCVRGDETGLANSSIPPMGASLSKEELSTNEMHAFNSLARKILSAEWFQRAWCNHEFRTSRRHIFLIRAESTTQDTRPCVVRFTTPFLYELLFRFDDESLAQDQLSTGETTRHYLQRLKSTAMGDDVAQGAVGEGWLRAYTNISRLGAGGDPNKDVMLQKKYATRDKYTILLNTTGKGISYKGSIMSEEESCRNLLAVALAARDPTALCTTGRWLRLGRRWSWMQQPTDSDFLASSIKTTDEYPPMPESKMILDPSSESRWISLELSVIYQDSFSTSTEEQHLKQRAVRWAQMFVDICIELKISLLDDLGTPTANLIASQGIPPYLRNNLINTLGGCGAFGREWFARACIPLDASQLDPKKREAALISLNHFGLDDTADETRAYLNQADGRKAAETILQLIVTMISAGIPSYSIYLNGGTPSVWQPMFITSRAGRKVLIYVPQDPALSQLSNLAIAIPAALLSDSYSGLSRVWLLRKHEEEGRECWELVYKTRLFGDVADLSFDDPILTNLSSQYVYGAGQAQCRNETVCSGRLLTLGTL